MSNGVNGFTVVPNTHVHTPYSFSCFDSIDQAVEQALREKVRVLGISDFNTVEGLEEFCTRCDESGIYPLFNIEFIAFSSQDREAKRRWNDPKNPGIMYFCGKALNCPATLSADSRKLLASLWKGTQDHIWQTILKVNECLTRTGLSVRLDYNEIRTRFARNTVRERHVAKALFFAFGETWPDSRERLASYRALFSDSGFAGDIEKSALMQNEIRNRLLKAGKPAYVEERSEAFLSLAQVMRLVLDGGGIPSYPVLADTSMPFTEYENDPDELAQRLTKLNIHAVEFIPSRNEIATLKRYVTCFHERGFCVTFGTEHNTPESQSLIPAAQGGVPFDDFLKGISMRGAAILAAHQHRHKGRRNGFVDAGGLKLVHGEDLEEFVRQGERLIRERLGTAPTSQPA